MQLGAVVIGVVRGQQRLRAGVMNATVVQHGQARVSEQIGPDVAMEMGVTDLIDTDVVIPFAMTPHELVCVQDPHVSPTGCRVKPGRSRDAGAIDEDVDRVAARGEERDELCRPARDAAALRRPRRKPRNPHATSIGRATRPYTSRMKCRQVAGLVEEACSESVDWPPVTSGGSSTRACRRRAD